MISILVQRPPADRQGPDISDPLLAAPIAARERGRIEIDRESTDRVLVQVTGPYLGWLSPGSLVEYRGRRGSWRGLARRCALTLTRSEGEFRADHAVELEREP